MHSFASAGTAATERASGHQRVTRVPAGFRASSLIRRLSAHNTPSSSCPSIIITKIIPGRLLGPLNSL